MRVLREIILAGSMAILAIGFCISGSTFAAQNVTESYVDHDLKLFVRNYMWLEVNFSARAHDLFIATPEGRRSIEDYDTFDKCESYEYMKFWLKHLKQISIIGSSPNISPNYKTNEILHDPKKIVVDIEDKILTALSDSGDVQNQLDAAQGVEFRRLELKYVNKYLHDAALQTNCREFEYFRRKRKLIIGVPEK